MNEALPDTIRRPKNKKDRALFHAKTRKTCSCAICVYRREVLDQLTPKKRIKECRRLFFMFKHDIPPHLWPPFDP